MTQNEKDILLKDLCSRLTYGVKVKFGDSKPALLTVIEHDEFGWQIGTEDEFGGMITFIDNVKPYLFPMSSMTDKKKKELSNICNCTIHVTDWEITFPSYEDNNMDNWQKVLSWCYENHYDINGFIPIGLAEDATGKNIY